jgi:hypothetical protein
VSFCSCPRSRSQPFPNGRLAAFSAFGAPINPHHDGAHDLHLLKATTNHDHE